MYRICDKAKNGQWKEYKINSWNDLLFYIFKKCNREKKKYYGNLGLKNVITEIKKYYEINKKMPTSKTAEFRYIYQLCRKGIWSSLNIKSWEELQKTVFKILNIDKNG